MCPQHGSHRPRVAALGLKGHANVNSAVLWTTPQVLSHTRLLVTRRMAPIWTVVTEDSPGGMAQTLTAHTQWPPTAGCPDGLILCPREVWLERG